MTTVKFPRALALDTSCNNSQNAPAVFNQTASPEKLLSYGRNAAVFVRKMRGFIVSASTLIASSMAEQGSVSLALAASYGQFLSRFLVSATPSPEKLAAAF